MKKLISLSLALMLLLSILAVPAMAEESNAVGQLSYLAMTEEEDQSFLIRRPLRMLLDLRGVVKTPVEARGKSAVEFYDSLDALLMGFQAGKVNKFVVPYYTARYLSSTNDGLRIATEFYPEKATGIGEWALSLISDGYSFLLKEENTALRDELDAQLTAMKEDGTLQKLIDEHIIKASESGEPVAVAFEKFEGEPMKVAVTGSLPPMDYVAADGSFAGFNTAVLAEIGKRMQKNIELVQVDSVGRALALSQGTVDVVFWTRGLSENMLALLKSGEGLEDVIAKTQDTLTEEEQALINEIIKPDQDMLAKWISRDLPEGTIITQPYFSDFEVVVINK